MTKNERNEFTFNEFVRVYFEAEKLLIQKIEETSNKMLTLKQESDDIQKKYELSFKNETHDLNGISSENFLKITFEKIRNNGANNSLLSAKQIYLWISSNDDDEDAKTLPFYLETYENLINQAIILYFFIFLIKIALFILFSHKNRKNLRSSFIYIYIQTDDVHLGTYQIGKIVLNTGDYEDQQIHREEKIFSNKKNQILDISLEFSIIWCFSKMKFYADGITKWNEKMDWEEEKLNFLRKKLNIIYEPLRVFDSRRKILPMNPIERLKRHGKLKYFFS